MSSRTTQLAGARIAELSARARVFIRPSRSPNLFNFKFEIKLVAADSVHCTCGPVVGDRLDQAGPSRPNVVQGTKKLGPNSSIMLPFSQGPLRFNPSSERGRRRNARPERYDASVRAPLSTIFFSKPSKAKKCFSVDTASTTPLTTAPVGIKHKAAPPPGLQEEALECFRLYDRDGDGLVPVTEVASMLRSLGFVVRVEQIKAFEAEMRCQKTTSVNFETFSSIVSKGLPRTVDPADVLDAFHLLDREKKGSVNVEELRDLMTTVGDPLSEADWQTLLNRTLITRESVTPASLKSGTFLRLICGPPDGEGQWATDSALAPQTAYKGPLL